MILKSLLALTFLAAAILLFAATRPATFRVQRSITIAASPQGIFPLLDNFHNWPRWAPQDKEDATMIRTYSGPQEGPRAVSDWQGARNTGKGRMTILESQPPFHVSIQADWVRPFHTRNFNDFLLEPAGASTRVTWTMQGRNLYPMKLMGLFLNMDKMMGKHFEAGLQNLKLAAER